jgi:hypothetical protein
MGCWNWERKRMCSCSTGTNSIRELCALPTDPERPFLSSRGADSELDMKVKAVKHLLQIDHDYETKSITIHLFQCSWLNGAPTPIGCDELRWVKPGELANYQHPLMFNSFHSFRTSLEPQAVLRTSNMHKLQLEIFLASSAVARTLPTPTCYISL